MVEKIEDILKKHQGEWLAIRVAEWDKYTRPVSGELLVTAKTHHELHTRLQDPNVYEIYAGELPVKAVLF
jgi:hypothetical protein